MMTPCIDGETLAAWSAGALRPAEAANVEGHIADCARCQAMLAVFVRSEPVVAPSPAWWQRWQVRWLVPLATAATVAAIWVASSAPDVTVRQPITPEMSARSTPPSAPPAGTPSTQAGIETRQTAPPPPQAGVGSTTAARQPLDSLRNLEQQRDLQANVPAARDKRLAAVPPPSSVPAPSARAAPAPSPPAAATSAAAPSAREEATFRAAVESPVAQLRRAIVEITSPDVSVRWRIVGVQVERSTDSGARWEPVVVPSGMVLTAGHSPAANVAWLVGPAGAIAVTNNGTRFDRVPFAETADLVAVVAVNDREATVTTSDGRVFHTTDRGMTWTRR